MGPNPCSLQPKRLPTPGMPLGLGRLIGSMGGQDEGHGAELRGKPAPPLETLPGVRPCAAASPQRPPCVPWQRTLPAREQGPLSLPGLQHPSAPFAAPWSPCPTHPGDESHRRVKKALTSWQGSSAPNPSPAAEPLVSCPGGQKPWRAVAAPWGHLCPAGTSPAWHRAECTPAARLDLRSEQPGGSCTPLSLPASVTPPLLPRHPAQTLD